MQHYRNKIDITSLEGEMVDAESLWIKRGELMILVDDDRYASAPYDEQNFYQIELK